MPIAPPVPKRLTARLASTALGGALLESQARRRLAQLEQAQRARTLAQLRRRHRELADTVNLPLLAAVQRWTDPQTLNRRREPVRRQLTGIAEQVQALMRTPDGPAIASGETPWNEVQPRLFQALLAGGEAVRRADPALSIEIATVLLAARPASRATWRMQALAAEHAGDLPTAIRAHQCYLNLTHGEALGVVDRVRRLQERDDHRRRLVRALTTAGPGTLPDGAQNVLDRLEKPTPRGKLDRAVAEWGTVLAGSPVEDLSRPATQDVLHQVSRWNRQAEVTPPPLDEDTVRRLSVLRLNDLRQRLRGRRLCVIEDASNQLRGTGLGARVDGYDVVVRVGAVRSAPHDSGHRTDLQVIRHDAVTGWDTPVGTRMILAADPGEWVTAIRSRLVPGRQQAVAEKGLHRPLNAALGEEAPERSDAYQLIRLLDLLAVCERVDLFGFRPTEDFTPAELAWLSPRLERLDDQAIGVR